jgi:hypothetical protein
MPASSDSSLSGCGKSCGKQGLLCVLISITCRSSLWDIHETFCPHALSSLCNMIDEQSVKPPD